ncbi:Palmitoyltransferase ZDHHC3 [Trichinella pseudospiralis]|uniref:Palmitoyltransferase n=1 Tax=Trichinella pseudospiralis TaxID=6337 RepID=A0A0V1JLN1_TRIPS|nr:Palmitoyltransferase ZDHHC3 [Trichinella pseudospiralis]
MHTEPPQHSKISLSIFVKLKDMQHLFLRKCNSTSVYLLIFFNFGGVTMIIRCRWYNVFILTGLILVFFGFRFLFDDSLDFSNPFPVDIGELMKICLIAAETSGFAIADMYQDGKVWLKMKSWDENGKKEFLTKADLISNRLIIESFSRFPDIKIISEERGKVYDEKFDFYKSQYYEKFASKENILAKFPSIKVLINDISVWIDPLDGTQELIEGMVESVSVMICVALKGRPVFGVIHRPFTSETIWSISNYGCFPDCSMGKNGMDMTDMESNIRKIALISRTHSGGAEKILEAALGNSWRIEKAGGSGYKGLRVLNGSAGLYLHTTTVKKWDVCAVDAVIHSAGGRMTDLTGKNLSYLPSTDETYKTGLLVTMNEHFYYLSKLLPSLSSIMILLAFGEFSVIGVLSYSSPNDWFHSVVNCTIFHILLALALISHIKTMLTDPGAIPKGNASEESMQLLNLKRGETVYKCGKCYSIKPERAHHCSICQRCIRKMDHHCPWVNNCVGEGNQKFFVLFTFYIALISCHAIYWAVWKFLRCLEVDWKGCSRFSPQETTFILVILLCEALLFALFTIIMFCTQMYAIYNDETTIEQMKRGKRSWSKRNRLSSVKAVFGSKVSLSWLNPLSVPFSTLKPTEYTSSVCLCVFVLAILSSSISSVHKCACMRLLICLLL